ncbi:tRNA pseudouridine(38-40) synthase TruA [Campylobacter curvus]|uniref:tRNA pseudouridine(38-40) synthase TruA n=1 Tax=Campylobacter curvus TaxID=200 RepID=UPI00146FD812|nr:tRNA pseudouridine(38-40) synthase TruA [Campylobacter curvus]
MKIQLIFSYDGSKFQGSQTQPHENGVQDALARALAHVGVFGKLVLSSRTDKGVHATAQSAAVECGEHFKDLDRLKNLINRHAHPFIHIKNIKRVNENFQARYDAKARLYRYIIDHGRYDVFRADHYLFAPKFDTARANRLLKIFIGEHDFSAFMKTGSGTKSPVRQIYKAYCYEYKNKTVIVFKANGFLRAQVRLMVASLLKALNLKDGGKLLNLAINHKKPLTRIPAAAQGLYLSRVFYR